MDKSDLDIIGLYLARSPVMIDSGTYGSGLRLCEKCHVPSDIEDHKETCSWKKAKEAVQRLKEQQEQA